MNRTVKNSAIYLSGTIIMAVLGFVNTMLLTRIVSQQVYAMYGLLTTSVTAITMFISFGFDTSYMRFYYNHTFSQKQYLFKCLKIPFIILVLFAIILFEPSQSFLVFIFDSKFSFYAILILLAYICSAVLHRFSQITARMEQFAGNYIISNIVCRSGFILILAIAYFLLPQISFNMVLISFLISSTASVLINLVIFKKVDSKANCCQDVVTQKDLFLYGFPYMINNVLLLVIPVIEKIVIRDLVGWEVLSIYTAAAVFQTVVMLLSNTITNIWKPIVFKNCNDPKMFKPILHDFGIAAMVIVTIGLSACILLRRWLVLLLGSDYRVVYIIAPTVCFGACFNIVTLIYSVGIDIQKKTFHLVVAPIIQAVISIGLLFLLTPRLGLIGVAIATLVSIVVSKTYKILISFSLYNTGRGEYKSVLLCIVCVASSFGTLFFTSLVSDILISVLLIIFMLLILNKDIVPLYKTVVGLIKPTQTQRNV